MIGSLTYLDAALIAVALISGLLAMYRGLARELLSILSWIAAAAIGAWIFFTKKELSVDVAAQTGLPQPVALAVVALVVALIVLIIVHLITARISDAILDSSVGMIDRVLGFVFGAVRGFILIVIPYMFYQSFFPDEQQHFAWVKDSQSLPYIKSTGETIRALMVEYAPSSLTNPSATPPAQPGAAPATGEQQGFLHHNGRLVTLAINGPKSYISAS